MFHIGLAKTGTSTIQETMAANVKALRARGIIYPVVNNRRRQVAHHILPQTLKAEGINAPPWEKLRSFRQQARESTVLLSAEGFSGTKPHMVRKGIGGDEARVIVYLRNYPAWVVSAYGQRAKWGGTDLSFDDYLEGDADGRLDRIADRLLEWADVFGPGHVRVRSLDSGILTNGQVIDDFLAALGTTREGLTLPPNVNETPDWRVVELLKERHARHAAETGLSADDRMPARRKAFEAGLAAGKRLGWTQRAEYLTAEQRRRLTEQYRADRERLMAAIPDCRIADIEVDGGRERPFLPSPEMVSPADRRAFDAAFSEAMTGVRVVNTARSAGRLLRSLQGVARRVWS